MPVEPPATAVLRFHLRVGVRLSLHAMVPLLVPFIAMVGTAPSPSAFLAALALSLATSATAPAILAVFSAVFLGTASWAAPRLTHGLDGWIRHLPAGAAAHRRAAAAALAAVQAPALFLALLLVSGTLVAGGAVSMAKVAGLPVAAFGAAYAALPVRRRIVTAPLGTVAVILALAGGWRFLLAAIAAVAGAELLAGPVRGSARVQRFQRGRGTAITPWIAWRALGRRCAGAYPAALLPLLACVLFVSNNALEPARAALAVRLAGATSATILLAGLAHALAVRRPSWPWARSLPWSSTQRVGLDAAFLALHALPLIVASAWIDARAAMAILALLPLLGLRAADAVRASAGERAGAGGRIAAEGIIAAMLVALLPWLALFALAASPLALRAAARREREIKVSRWSELHHLAAGDTLSWTA
jgi:hypothetical protein